MPGWTQLEVDRRRIQRRMNKLEGELKRLAKTRATQRKARRRRELPTISLVGYTNAGKSTAAEPADPRRRPRRGPLVLDARSHHPSPSAPGRRGRAPQRHRRIRAASAAPLVEAFRSTLEEVAQVDMLVHVVDAGAPDAEQQIEAVRAVLREIGASHQPELLVVNKIDLADPAVVDDLVSAHPDTIAVSATTGEGVEKLDEILAARLRALDPVVELAVPYERGDSSPRSIAKATCLSKCTATRRPGPCPNPRVGC